MTGRPAEVERGYQLLRQGRRLDVLRLTGQILESSPENPHALVLAAEAYVQAEKRAEAIGVDAARHRRKWRKPYP